MTLEEYNAFCSSLPHTSTVIQWRGAYVWKVGGKVFCIARFLEDGEQFSFKCSPVSFDVLIEEPGIRPAPHLASRGMKWVQRIDQSSMDDAALKDYLRESHRLASLNLPKAMQKRFGLNQV
jgi:predicted DNA-binding protein (MmcQ/YjbR family)